MKSSTADQQVKGEPVDVIDRKQLKAAGGLHKLAPQPPHYTIHYSIFSESHKLAPRPTHNTVQGVLYTILSHRHKLARGPQVLLRHPQVSTHSQVLAPSLLLISLIFCGIFSEPEAQTPHTFNEGEAVCKTANMPNVCGLYCGH